MKDVYFNVLFLIAYITLMLLIAIPLSIYLDNLYKK